MTTANNIFKAGKLEGELKGKTENTIVGIKNALSLGKLSIEDIATIFNVTTDYVLQIKKEHGTSI
jgi:prophage maintenance system killer protein